MAEPVPLKMDDQYSNFPQPQLPIPPDAPLHAPPPHTAAPLTPQVPPPDQAPAPTPGPFTPQAIVVAQNPLPTPSLNPVPAPAVAPATAPGSLTPQTLFVAQTSVQTPAPAVAPATSFRLPEHLMHKNRLQEYTQRSAILLPIYQTFNEGFQHLPKFRSTVWVDRASYTSPNTFSHRKAAEQDVAKLALECISKKIKDEGCPLIREDTVFCKSILNEFAVKMNMEKPIYNTIQPEGLLPIFISSLVFKGVTYTGEAGRNKKEAEQLAARAVILSLLGTSGSGTLLSEIIKSKIKLYAALHKVKDSRYLHNMVGADVGNSSGISLSEDKEIEAPVATANFPTSAIPGTSSGMHPPHHEFKIPKPEVSPEAINLPIAFVHPVSEQPLGVGPSSGKRRRKNKKKANKKVRIDPH